MHLGCFATLVQNHDVLAVSHVFFVRNWETLAFWSLSFVIFILLVIVAVVALTQLGAGDSSLEALTVVLLALGLAAVTSFEVMDPVV